jgi:hypothetical protein
MLSTRTNRLSTMYQSPPRPPSRRLPSVASGENHDVGFVFLGKAGSTLTDPHFGLDNGVHLTPRSTKRRLTRA